MSPIGTELPIPNVRSPVANGGKADKICSMRVLRILTRCRHGLGCEIPVRLKLAAPQGSVEDARERTDFPNGSAGLVQNRVCYSLTRRSRAAVGGRSGARSLA